jgi:hypothetical protein
MNAVMPSSWIRRRYEREWALRILQHPPSFSSGAISAWECEKPPKVLRVGAISAVEPKTPRTSQVFERFAISAVAPKILERGGNISGKGVRCGRACVRGCRRCSATPAPGLPPPYHLLGR